MPADQDTITVRRAALREALIACRQAASPGDPALVARVTERIIDGLAAAPRQPFPSVRDTYVYEAGMRHGAEQSDEPSRFHDDVRQWLTDPEFRAQYIASCEEHVLEAEARAAQHAALLREVLDQRGAAGTILPRTLVDRIAEALGEECP
ncbi:MAG TPA: hypothetical protein VFA70_15700 [Dehalococcoidia bacterium]|nr:hypothetical protein [Dehalococcoidia bacterium]